MSKSNNIPVWDIGNNLVDSGIAITSIGGGSSLPTGSIIDYAGSTAPTDWLLCYGQAVSRTTYSALFTVISTIYGSGDGSTTFNLPDTRGRALVGLDSNAGVLTLGSNLGNKLGSQTHTLTIDEIPSHTHTVTIAGDDAGFTNLEGGQFAFGNHTTSATGGGQSHNNVQPTLCINKIIKI